MWNILRNWGAREDLTSSGNFMRGLPARLSTMSEEFQVNTGVKTRMPSST
uniref:Uncharacterized protein n=1 Tax=Arion vulgaris TaxID=1028688 RepID=A0A0B7BMC8_9EUPU